MGDLALSVVSVDDLANEPKAECMSVCVCVCVCAVDF